MTDQQVQEQEAVKGPRLLGKWDYIGCALFAILGSIGNHVFLYGTAVAIENILGRIIGTIILWALIKMIFLWIRDKFSRT